MAFDPNPYESSNTADLPAEARVDSWNLPAIALGLAISSGAFLVLFYFMHPMHIRGSKHIAFHYVALPWAILCPLCAACAIAVGYRRSVAFWAGAVILLAYLAWPRTWEYWDDWLRYFDLKYWQ